MKCEKHNRRYETRQMGHGKTMHVCPECEQERIEKFAKMFGFDDKNTKPEFQLFNQIVETLNEKQKTHN